MNRAILTGKNHPPNPPEEAPTMLALSVLGAIVVTIGVTKTAYLVATDGYGRVPTIRRF